MTTRDTRRTKREHGRLRRMMAWLGLVRTPPAPPPEAHAPAPPAEPPPLADVAPEEPPAGPPSPDGAEPPETDPRLLTNALAGLAMRDLTLVDSLLATVEELEDMAEDPDLLEKLFQVDNLATRMRRNGENLLILADQEGNEPHIEAVPLLDVARAATSEISAYDRVHIGRLPEKFVDGAAADDVSHLLAELLDNATAHSPDHAQVVISGQLRADGGLLFAVEDEGIGIPRDQLADLNRRLSGAPVLDDQVIRHMGLYVASRIAHRHGLTVQLEARAFRGMNAYTVIPPALLRDTGGESESAATGPTRTTPSVAPMPPASSGPRSPQQIRRDPPESAVTSAGLPRRSAYSGNVPLELLRERSDDADLTDPPESSEDRAARIRAELDGFIEGERAAASDHDKAG